MLNNAVIDSYNSYDGNITGLIKTFKCDYKNNCIADIEYTINDVKYLNNHISVPNNLKENDKIKLKYPEDRPDDPYYFKVDYNVSNHESPASIK